MRNALCIATTLYVMATTVAVAEQPEPAEVKTPEMDKQQIASEAVKSASNTGVGIPLTFLSIGSIVLGSATP